MYAASRCKYYLIHSVNRGDDKKIKKVHKKKNPNSFLGIRVCASHSVIHSKTSLKSGDHVAAHMTSVEEIDYWAEAEAALSISKDYDHHKEFDSDEEDEYGNNLLVQEAKSVESSIIRLEDGDIHLCGSDCPYATMCKKTGDLVCPFSSMVIGHVSSERTDYSTGRNAWSADPDMHGGSSNGGCGWRKKIDKVAASKQAHRLSTQLDDSVMPRAKYHQKLQATKQKRGALCVDEKTIQDTPIKKIRMSKKRVETKDQMTNLVSEAAVIYTKLLVSKSSSSHSSSSLSSSTYSLSANHHSIDTRLLNGPALFNSALKKYLKESMENRKRPCMDDIHNMALVVQDIVNNTQQKLRNAQTAEAERFRSVRFREVVSRLAVSLWKAACQTPYMGKARRGGDSFRPFCIGVYYSLKRGLTLSDGTMLVPAFELFQNVLPSAKEISSNSASKTLHASSHRGLCSIHRCIASIDIKTQHAIFAPALRLVTELLHAR